MTAHDPILNAILLRAQRALLFGLLVILLSCGLWVWVLLEWYATPWLDLWVMTKSSWEAGVGSTATLLLKGCLAIGLLTATLAYLTVALWWRRSGDVFRRGARFIARREG